MRTHTRFWSPVQNLRVILTGLFVILSCNASAVTINFDDIDAYQDPDGGCFCDHPLTDEYRDRGLVIDSGYLVGQKLPDGSNDNLLLGSLTLTLLFVDKFPTTVSFIVNAVYDQAVFVDAVGLNGWGESKQTSGYAGPFDDTPYLPNQVVSFYSPEGISRISLSTFYNLRVSTTVDNLTYDYVKLPEPHAALLMLAGLLVLISLRQRSSK